MHPHGTRTLDRQGFSVVELLIVVVILGVLATVVTQLAASSALEAEANAARAQLAIVRRQIEVYQLRWEGALPPEASGVQGLWTALCSDTLEHRALLTRRPELPRNFSWTWNGEKLGVRYSGQDPGLEGEVGGW